MTRTVEGKQEFECEERLVPASERQWAASTTRAQSTPWRIPLFVSVMTGVKGPRADKLAREILRSMFVAQTFLRRGTNACHRKVGRQGDSFRHRTWYCRNWQHTRLFSSHVLSAQQFLVIQCNSAVPRDYYW